MWAPAKASWGVFRSVTSTAIPVERNHHRGGRTSGVEDRIHAVIGTLRTLWSRRNPAPLDSRSPRHTEMPLPPQGRNEKRRCRARLMPIGVAATMHQYDGVSAYPYASRTSDPRVCRYRAMPTGARTSVTMQPLRAVGCVYRKFESIQGHARGHRRTVGRLTPRSAATHTVGGGMRRRLAATMHRR